MLMLVFIDAITRWDFGKYMPENYKAGGLTVFLLLFCCAVLAPLAAVAYLESLRRRAHTLPCRSAAD